MEKEILLKKFEAVGARLRARMFPNDAAAWERHVRPLATDAKMFRINILRDQYGEFFDLLAAPDLAVEVVDLQPRDRHLLLMTRDAARKDKFLCGHDERHWFVAAVPDKPGVSGVRSAMEALKPPAVMQAQESKRLAGDARRSRKNKAFIRQGEWFFVPATRMDRVIDPSLVLKNEPISRGRGGKPHRCEFLYREANSGEQVHVCSRHPAGLSAMSYAALLKANPRAHKWGWTVMMRNPKAYVRGAVSHADHATIYLHGWHRVLMNTENEAPSQSHVAFLD